MACSAHDIPTLEFPRDEIIEVIPGKLPFSGHDISILTLTPDSLLQQ